MPSIYCFPDASGDEVGVVYNKGVITTQLILHNGPISKNLQQTSVKDECR